MAKECYVSTFAYYLFTSDDHHLWYIFLKSLFLLTCETKNYIKQSNSHTVLEVSNAVTVETELGKVLVNNNKNWNLSKTKLQNITRAFKKIV